MLLHGKVQQTIQPGEHSNYFNNPRKRQSLTLQQEQNNKDETQPARKQPNQKRIILKVTPT